MNAEINKKKLPSAHSLHRNPCCSRFRNEPQCQILNLSKWADAVDVVCRYKVLQQVNYNLKHKDHSPDNLCSQISSFHGCRRQLTWGSRYQPLQCQWKPGWLWWSWSLCEAPWTSQTWAAPQCCLLNWWHLGRGEKMTGNTWDYKS